MSPEYQQRLIQDLKDTIARAERHLRWIQESGYEPLRGGDAELHEVYKREQDIITISQQLIERYQEMLARYTVNS